MKSLFVIPVQKETSQLEETIEVGVSTDGVAGALKHVGRNYPKIFETAKYFVVIFEDDVVKYPKNLFEWLCGIGPNPSDPNWMGHAQGDLFNSRNKVL